ncbi:hypothetical protein HID58_055781, partial [Brassica napus]
RLPSETIKQSAEPAETVTSVLAGHQAGSARSSHHSLVPSLDILVAIHSRLPSETIKQSAEPAETVASVLAGHQAGSARSSHRSSVPSLDILVAIHSCRDQN